MPTPPPPEYYRFSLLGSQVEARLEFPRNKGVFGALGLGTTPQISIVVTHGRTPSSDSLELCDKLLARLERNLKINNNTVQQSGNCLVMRGKNLNHETFEAVCDLLNNAVKEESKQHFYIQQDEEDKDRKIHAELYLSVEEILHAATPKLALHAGDETTECVSACSKIRSLVNRLVSLKCPEVTPEKQTIIHQDSQYITQWNNPYHIADYIYREVATHLEFMQKYGQKDFEKTYLSREEGEISAHDAVFLQMAASCNVRPSKRSDMPDTPLPPKREEIENALFTLQRSGEIPSDVSAPQIIQFSDILLRGMLKRYYIDNTQTTNSSICGILQESHDHLPDSIKELNIEQLGRSLQTALKSLPPETGRQSP